MKNFKKLIIGLVVVALLAGSAVASSLLQGEVNRLIDGDMERVGTSAYSAGASAVLTKEVGGIFDDGQVMKVAHGGQANPYAWQPVIENGKTYRVYGYAESDGTAVPVLRTNAGIIVWSGTNSHTDPQLIDFTFDSTGTALRFRATTSVASYVLFDNITVTEYIPPVKNAEETLLIDGDMERTGVSDWSAIRATLTKEDDGAGGQVLRLTSSADPAQQVAIQNVGMLGKTVRVTGRARSDGTLVPRLGDLTNGNRWVGSTSVNWQYFDIIFVAQNDNIAPNTNLLEGNYAEFDNIIVTEYTPPLKNYETQILVDGDMDRVGVADWIAGNSAVLTKVTKLDGSALNIVSAGGTSYADQGILISGKTYRVTGCAYGGTGISIPRLYFGGIFPAWDGTTSTERQCFDEILTAGNTAIRLYGWGAGSVIFDDVLVTLIP